MSDHFQTDPDHFQANPFDDPLPQVLRACPPLPVWLERRLLGEDEQITWVRGPRLNPSWERYATHPALFLFALVLGAAWVAAGRLAAGSWSDMSPLLFLVAGVLVVGSIFVLGISAGYFTRLVVTNLRIVLLQGYEVCRIWSLDDLPPSLIRYGRRGGEGEGRSVDLEALQTMLGGSPDQFIESKTLRAFGKKLDGIIAREKRYPGPGRTQPRG
jgi:hypothetical protein